MFRGFMRRLAARLAVRRYIRKKVRSLRLEPDSDYERVGKITGRMDLEVANYLARSYRMRSRSLLCGFLFPAEMAHAYGIVPLFTETIGAITAGSPFASEALEVAELRGYSRDGCSFHRAMLGAGLAGFLPKYDMIVSTSHLCDGQNKSLEALATATGTPYFMLDVPQEPSEAAVDYVSAQLGEIEAAFADLSGRKVGSADWARVIAASNAARESMSAILDLRCERSLPLYGLRAFNLYFQAQLSYGTEFLKNLLAEMLEELEAMPDGEVGERFRMIWLLAYPYFKGNFVPYMEKELGMHAVAEDLSRIYWEPLDPAEPLRSLAAKLLANPFLGPADKRVVLIRQLAAEHKANGVIHFSHWGCRQGCGSVRPIADALARDGVPFLDLDGDCVDNRNYSEGPTRTRLEGFAELMAEKKGVSTRKASRSRRDLYLGVDIGSLSAKAAVVDGDGRVVSTELILTGASSKRATARLKEMIFADNGLGGRIAACVATGYGRNAVDFADERVTEITCHARGMAHQAEGVRTIIDIGGQDTKAILVAPGGGVVRFLMNDKCAAGTGRFLEVMARTLEIDLEDFGPRALEAKRAVTISSMCTVFAESEVVSLIAEGAPIEEIARGVCESIASRTVALLERVGKERKIAMSGGVAKNVGVVSALERALGSRLVLPSDPQVVGAIGAALIARDSR